MIRKRYQHLIAFWKVFETTFVAIGLPKVSEACAKSVGPAADGEAAARAHTAQAFGRILIVAVFLFYASQKVPTLTLTRTRTLR